MAMPRAFSCECAGGAQPEACQQADQRRSQCWDCAKQALGIAGAFVQMRCGEDLPVEPRDQVAVVVEQGNVASGKAVAGDGNKAHQQPIADQRGDEQRHLVFPTRTYQIERRDDEVADGDSRQHSVKAHGVQIEEREAVDHQPEQIEDDRPARPCAGRSTAFDAPCAMRACGREDRRDANQKEEGRKDQVGGREAVPGGVLHRPVCLLAVAIVVDHDHEADGEPAQHIERNHPRGFY